MTENKILEKFYTYKKYLKAISSLNFVIAIFTLLWVVFLYYYIYTPSNLLKNSLLTCLILFVCLSLVLYLICLSLAIVLYKRHFKDETSDILILYLKQSLITIFVPIIYPIINLIKISSIIKKVEKEVIDLNR